MMSRFTRAVGACLAMAVTVAIPAKADDADLAQQLANPLAAMISVPFQLNYDHGYGPADGDRWRMNFQPVVPISLNDQWNLISRTIVPVVWQNDNFGNSGTQFGLGDTTQSVWLSPSTPTSFGLIWGIGGVAYIPTATNSLLGTDKWGAGPTVVGLIQRNGWTVGFLGNHIWSFGDSTINSSFLQPFLSYTTPDAWTFTVNTESTYDWTNKQWSVPINLTATKLVNFGHQPVSLGGGVRYHAESPANGPDGWGARLIATFLFPR